MIRNLLAATAATLTLCSAATAHAASYKGRSVDDHRFQGSVLNHDYGVHRNVEIKFQGDRAFVYFPAGGRLVLTLEDEEIVNPHSIPGHDARRGIVWEMNVHDLRGR